MPKISNACKVSGTLKNLFSMELLTTLVIAHAVERILNSKGGYNCNGTGRNFLFILFITN